MLGSLFGGGDSGGGSDPALEAQQREAEAKAAADKAAAEKKAREDAAAVASGLRGRRSLLSTAGGELGFKAPLGS